MKKALLLFSVVNFFAIFNIVVAQDNPNNYERNFKFGIGLNGGLPLNDPYELNLGGDIRVQYNISSTYSLCFTAGYNNLFAKDEGKNLAYVPLKVGYKTFLFSNEFYAMGELGGAFSTSKDNHANSMLFSPSVGYATKYIDISLGYQFLKNYPIIKNNVPDTGYAQLLLRLAYGFDL